MSMNQKELLNHLSTVCTHGSLVKNPYTGDTVFAPCNSCLACNYRKSRKNTIRAFSAFSLYKYCYFVTLTYANQYVPFATIEKDNYGNFHFNVRPRPVLYTPRLDEKGKPIINPKTDKPYMTKVRGLFMKDEFEFVLDGDPELIEDYIQQANLSFNGKYPHMNRKVGYICYEDFSLFMKRVKKNLFLKLGNYDTKIHYYVVCELSPKTFRPHFHILLFSDSALFAENIREIVYSSWKFGRVDCSAARSEFAVQYCATYTNAFSCVPSFLLRNDFTRPRGRFSVGFGDALFEPLAKTVDTKESVDRFVNGRTVLIDGNAFTLQCSRHLENSCYFFYARRFRVTCFELSAFIEQVYHIARFLRVNPGDTDNDKGESPMKFAWALYNFVTTYNPVEIYQQVLPPFMYDFLYFLRIDVYDPLINTLEYCEKFLSKVSFAFRHVIKFLRFWDIPFSKMLKYIPKIVRKLELSVYYFSRKEYLNLSRMMQFVEDSKLDILDFEMVPDEYNRGNLYKLVPEKLISTSLQNLIDSSIKHREINDMNRKYFTYD